MGHERDRERHLDILEEEVHDHEQRQSRLYRA